MRRLILATVLTVALPLSAIADTCITGELAHDDVGPYITSRPDVPDDTPVRAEIVGTFLNVHVGAEDPDLFIHMEGVGSVEIPGDAIGFSACESGAVKFTFPETEGPAAEPETVVDLDDLFSWISSLALPAGF